MIQDKVILITGGTGSLGRALTEYFLKLNPRKIIIFSRDEFKQHRMKKDGFTDNRIEYFLGDVRDVDSLKSAMKGVDIVVHTAALKHVNTGEDFPAETIKTNVIGTQNVASSCEAYGVQKAILISSDKAVEPINAYGQSKALAEKIFIAQNKRSSKCLYSIVRYGNVIGSRGSILDDIFKKKPDCILITNVYMTRFWLTLEDACKLVWHAIINMNGGEIFIPKIKTMDLCDVFNTVSPNSKLKVIGMRPGEKMDETLISTHEARRTVVNEDVYVVLPENYQGRRMGKPVKKKFVYTSKSCDEKFTQKDFLNVVKKYA